VQNRRNPALEHLLLPERYQQYIAPALSRVTGYRFVLPQQDIAPDFTKGFYSNTYGFR
jgi:hypothetical protein